MLEVAALLLGEAERLGDPGAVERDSLGVAGGVRILGVDGVREAADGRDVLAADGGEQAAVLGQQVLERLVRDAQLLDHLSVRRVYWRSETSIARAGMAKTSRPTMPIAWCASTSAAESTP